MGLFTWTYIECCYTGQLRKVLVSIYFCADTGLTAWLMGWQESTPGLWPRSSSSFTDWQDKLYAFYVYINWDTAINTLVNTVDDFVGWLSALFAEPVMTHQLLSFTAENRSINEIHIKGQVHKVLLLSHCCVLFAVFRFSFAVVHVSVSECYELWPFTGHKSGHKSSVTLAWNTRQFLWASICANNTQAYSWHNFKDLREVNLWQG